MALWHRHYTKLLILLAISFLLWVSGADAVIQLWLNINYNQFFNDITRTLGELGLGRNQVILCALVGCLSLVGGPKAAAARPVKRAKNKPKYRWWMCFGAFWKALPATPRAWFATLPVFAVTGVLVIILKLLVGRPRPKEILWNGTPYNDLRPGWLTGQFDASFMSWPSGHSASTFAIGTVLMLAFPRYKWLTLTVMVILSAARFLALTPHYLGDVVAGAALGSAVALVLAPRLLRK